ncbi:MAG TPA: cytochrome P450 [Actinomycetes bacterium]|jgi:cytochrome P450|nr:cytochrome P450 [Actinomycetes bacterium]
MALAVEAIRCAADLEGVDPFLPEWRSDPYPLYHRLRELDPVHRSRAGVWVLTRHADATAVLRDPRFSADPAHLRGRRPQVGPRRLDTRVLLFLDPPDHTRIRSLVSKAFTPHRLRQLRPRVEALVHELLDRIEEQGSLELIADLAYPLPVSVICELLGVPAVDRDTFRRWSSDASRMLDRDIDLDEQALERGAAAIAGFTEHFAALIQERRLQERDDLLSALIAAEEAGEGLTWEELLSTIILLFLAGHETTVNLIGNGALALLRHPDQLERLRREPSLGRTAVEELLRYDSPVHVTGRITTTELEVGGTPIAAGEQVIVLVAAANRDPAVFADPDDLDVGRPDNRHLSFSAGMHYCLGAALARLEAEVALGALLRRFPRLELADPEPRYRDHFVLRGLRSLPLRL